MRETKIFDELTGIRAIAAYLVFFHHVNIFKEKYVGKFIHDFVGEFHIGVTIFFVLSGFLITYRYYDIEQSYGRSWFKQYIKNRIARIYPMYFLLTAITFIVIIIQSKEVNENLKLFFYNITFLRGFFDSMKFSGIAQGWSLTVEECFYFSAPFIFMMSKRVKLIIPILTIFILGIVMGILFKGGDFMGSFKFILLFTFFGRVFEFYVGIKLALYYKGKYDMLNEERKIYYTTIGLIWIILSITLLVLVKPEEDFGVHTPLGIFINNVVLPIGIAILFLGLITEKTRLKKVLSTKLFLLLGKSSYIFYLIHIGVVYRALVLLTGNVFVVFFVLNIISILLYKYVEEPANRKIRKMTFFS